MTSMYNRQNSGGTRSIVEVPCSPSRRVRDNSIPSDLIANTTVAPAHKRKTSDASVLHNAVEISRINTTKFGTVFDEGDEDDVERCELPLLSSPLHSESGLATDEQQQQSGSGTGGKKSSSSPFVRGLQLAAVLGTTALALYYSPATRDGSITNAATSVEESSRVRPHESVGKPKQVYPLDNNDGAGSEREDGEEEKGPPLEFKPAKFNSIEFYDDASKVAPVRSTGPAPYEPDSFVGGGGGLHVFENVCVTNNVDAPRDLTDMRGLLYFTTDNDILDNPKRCVPCEIHNNTSNSEAAVGHNCGMNGLHLMYAKSIPDWNRCVDDEDNQRLTTEYGQTQSPLLAETVHFYHEPTFLLQFQEGNAEASLTDTLLTYLPYWHKFTREKDFPFDNVLSHSTDGCLSHSHNWFCEIAHQMGAFGRAREIPPEPDNTTLYCFKTLYYNQLGYFQRQQQQQGDQDQQQPLLTKEIMDEFRDVIFRKFAVPRPRDLEPMRKKDKRLKLVRNITSRLVFFASEGSSGENEGGSWNNMNELIENARSNEKYESVEFGVISDLADLTIAEQALVFNEADVAIMVRGEHNMANAIFSTDGTTFVELGCASSPPLGTSSSSSLMIGNTRFLELIDGTYESVAKCAATGKNDDNATDVCLSCDGTGGDFTMSTAAFEKLVDDVLTKRS